MFAVFASRGQPIWLFSGPIVILAIKETEKSYLGLILIFKNETLCVNIFEEPAMK